MTKSRYRPEFAVVAKQMVDAGCLDWQIARRLGFSDNTIYKWKEKYPPFGNAMRRRPAGELARDEQLSIRERLAPLMDKGFTSIDIARFVALLTGRHGWIKRFLLADRTVPEEVLAIAKEVLAAGPKLARWQRQSLGRTLGKPWTSDAEAKTGSVLIKPDILSSAVRAATPRAGGGETGVATCRRASTGVAGSGNVKDAGATRPEYELANINVAAPPVSRREGTKRGPGKTNKLKHFSGAGFDGSDVDGGL